MKQFFQRSALTLCVVAIAGCGGSDGNYINSNNTNNDDDTTTTSSAKALEVSVSSRQLGSSGDKPVTISAIAKDASNNILKDAPVQFSVNNDATIEADDSTTASAVKTAKLTPGLENPENRTVTVTVKSGSLVKTLDVAVTGTTLVLDGPTRVALNTPITFTAKLKDSADKALAHEQVTINSSLNNAITPKSGSGFVTDANGEVQFTVKAAVSGTDTISVSALGASTSKSLEISGDDFTISSTNGEIKVGSAEAINLKWTRNGVAQANKTIKVAATRGITPLQIVTDNQGQASFSITSATAGGTVITATDAATGLSTNLTREFVATTPASLSTQVERELLTPESTTNVITIVKDSADNPVKNQVVVFNLNDTVGGKLSSSTATTDSLGKATVGYTAGNAASAKDGVSIKSYLATNPDISKTVKLTVGGQSLRLVLGEDEKIAEDSIYYKKVFGVIVTDSAGNPVANKKVDFTLIPTQYLKGSLAPCGTLPDGTTSKSWSQAVAAVCDSEDTDHDGLLDANEDFNNSGMLEPTHAATVTGTGVTDAEGKVSVTVTYPQSQAWWSAVRLTAKVVVAGSEYVEDTEFVLPMLAGDLKCDSTPPNVISPYGVESSCASAK